MRPKGCWAFPTQHVHLSLSVSLSLILWFVGQEQAKAANPGIRSPPHD